MWLLRRAAFICSLLLIVGCVSSNYRPTEVNASSLHGSPIRIKDDNLQISVYVYSKLAHQQSVFQARLSNIGILPILIEVRNLGIQRHKLRKSDISLLSPAGQERNRLTAGAVARIVSAPIDTIRGIHCVGPACGIANIAIAMGGIEKNVKQATEESDRFADYRTKELQEVVLGPYESVQGFVYFESSVTDASVLVISLIDLNASKRTSFQIKL